VDRYKYTLLDVWLGPESEDSDLAVDFVHSMAADLVAADEHERAKGQKYIVLPGSETAKLLANLDDQLPRFNALNRLCRREWFTRLWIYQEYHLSKEAIGLVGSRTLDIRDLYNVVHFISTRELNREFMHFCSVRSYGFLN